MFPVLALVAIDAMSDHRVQVLAEMNDASEYAKILIGER